MKTRVAAAALLTFVVGCRTIEPAPAPDAPKIGSFTASKSRVASGESVTLSFTTSNATKVEIIDDRGRQLELAGDVASGSATVAPVDTSFYVLRASGVGGRDTAFVQIAVNAPLKDVFLIAVPGTIESGQQAQLLWGAAGASSATLTTGSGTPTTLMGTTGSVTVTPATSERYTLTAQGAPGTPPLTALADVQVRPTLIDAQLSSPDGVAPTKTLTFRWSTAGAQRVTISEQTFGQLVAVTDAASVVNGTYDFVIPSQLPSGIEVTDGLPLRFTVTASAEAFSVNKVLTAVVGDQPTIEVFDAPAAGTTGSTFTINWRTLNATAIEVRVGNLPIWGTLPAELARVAEGQVSLPSPNAQTDYTFVARNDRGAQATRIFTVRPVAPPVITSFTLTPTVTNLGDAATARWTTTDAVRVQLRLENGPVLRNVTQASQVASGNFGLLLASSARVVLVATNAAGQSVSQTRPFTFTGAVGVTPTPALRGSTLTLSWTLMAAGVTEVVGLPTPTGAPLPGSPNYLDLATSPTATQLVVQDPTDGVEKVPFPAGFHFPLLGVIRDDLWVSVNGFVSFSNAGGLPVNEDLSAANTAPSLLAPFWDDLNMGPNSKILVDTTTSTLGERILVVQWEKLQLAADANSQLSFQVQLYETGQVSFIYGALSGTLTGATIGVQDTSWPAAQQYAFDSMTTVPTPGLQLDYFSGAPANGMLSFPAAASRKINFVGRTTMNLIGATAETRTFGPGDLTITEVMPLPEASVTATGQWIEIKNNLGELTNIGGLQVTTPLSADGGLIFPDDTWIDGGMFFVVGQSTDPQLNGGAGVTFASDDIGLAMPGAVTLGIGGSSLSSLAWDAGVAGTSIVPKESVMLASGVTQMCPRVATFGPAGAFGTPGARNEPCTPSSPYSMSSIAGNFITAPGNSEILAAVDGDEGEDNLALPHPFTYFGTTFNRVGVATNGFITLSGTDLTSSYFSNNATVASTEPNGVIAPFWDDLDRDTGTINMWRLPDRTVISWQGVTFFLDSSSTTALNVQIHLYDSGVIELHYGSMSTTNSGTQPRVSGNSATVWIERPDGLLAVPFSINAANILPNSGVRFTPNP